MLPHAFGIGKVKPVSVASQELQNTKTKKSKTLRSSIRLNTDTNSLSPSEKSKGVLFYLNIFCSFKISKEIKGDLEKLSQSGKFCSG